MECTVASNYNSEPSKSVPTNGLPSVKNDKTTKSGLRVNFTEKGEVKERREKFLTAKYGSHQMSLIRKRLAVEMWLYEELQKLCTDASIAKEIEVDIDELLDLDDDDQRRQHIKELMLDIADGIPEKVKKFSDDLLEKMKTL
ncbi:protein phosphatase 1 regulatory subunit 14B isoform X2 [Planococcus citri]